MFQSLLKLPDSTKFGRVYYSRISKIPAKIPILSYVQNSLFKKKKEEEEAEEEKKKHYYFKNI